MTKNKGKGGKNRRRGKKQGDSEKRELEFKGEDQEYAQVSKMLGNGRLEATCFDGTARLCHIRGTFRKRVWINVGDIVLLGLREYQDGKADVIHKYSPEEARTLKAYGEIPERIIIGGFVDGDEDGEGEGGIAFGGEDGGVDSSDSEDGAGKKDDEPEDWNKALSEL